MLFKYKPAFTIEQFFAAGVANERKITFALDVISLIKSKHTVLNKRSSSLKPKSVTFRDEEEQLVASSSSGSAMKHSMGHGRNNHSSLQRSSGPHSSIGSSAAASSEISEEITSEVVLLKSPKPSH